MEISGARFGDHIDDIAGTEAELGGKAVGLEPELLRLINSRRVHDRTPLAIGVPMAVQKPLCIAESASREVQEGQVLVGIGRIRAGATGPLNESLVGDGRVEENQAGDIPFIQRKIEDFLLVHIGRDIGILSVQLRRL
ncbi:MAG: hypothetical protein ABSG62_08040 [Terracidiphilus sp.]